MKKLLFSIVFSFLFLICFAEDLKITGKYIFPNTEDTELWDDLSEVELTIFEENGELFARFEWETPETFEMIHLDDIYEVDFFFFLISFLDKPEKDGSLKGFLTDSGENVDFLLEKIK